MSLVSVKAKEGRVAFTASRGGDRIPTDRFVTVDHTPWIARLIDVHEDLIVEPAPVAKPAAPPKSEQK